MTSHITVITHDKDQDEPSALELQEVQTHVIKEGALKATMGPGIFVYIPLHRIVQVIVKPQPEPPEPPAPQEERPSRTFGEEAPFEDEEAEGYGE